MWLLDEWAERHINDAQRRGDFDELPGAGKPLDLEDDSHIPPELRVAWRLLKNSGSLPPELEQRREAIEIRDFLRAVNAGHPDRGVLTKRLMLLELKLRQAGMDTQFLHGEYAPQLIDKETR